ncbi:alpha/beta hydrolase [Nitrosovibrio sp. Nv6]|uniref:alpha/beta hydrolase n=1 Tax=Nitrosovibrio sp. Nv6 TaxID=1855340 RepID=UPI00210170B4|nr:alpha/beta hydrolase [Nitrosovibrio sp. Nv6]
MSPIRMLLNLGIMVAIAYVIFAAVIFFVQPRLVYYPEYGRSITQTPDDLGLAYETVELATDDGEILHGWFVPAPDAAGTVLFFHGNAGNISHRMGYLLMFYRLGYNTFIIDYRGYGQSSGAPSESGTYKDAQSAWQYLTEKKDIAPSNVVLFGESLGAAVAAWLAAREKPALLVLASAFTSVPDMGAKLYPFLPIRLLSRFEYNTLEYLRSVNCPVFIAHSPQDEIVPFEQGRALYEAAPDPKQFLELQGGHNNGFIYMQEDWQEALGEFIRENSGTSP